MPKGPHEARLDTYLVNENFQDVYDAAALWSRTAATLQDISDALDGARPRVEDWFGGEVGPAAAKAFGTVSTYVASQAKELASASQVLHQAGAALEHATTVRQQLGSAPDSPPDTPVQQQGESHQHFAHRQQQVSTEQKAYADASQKRERESQAATQNVDTHYTEAIKVMAAIHGNPPTPDGTGGGRGDGGSIPISTPPGGGHVRTPPGGPGWVTPVDPGHDPGHGTWHDPGTPPVDYPTEPGGHVPGGGLPHYGDPGSPQGPGGPTGTPPGEPPFGLPPGSTTPVGPSGPSATSTAIGVMISGGIVGGTTGLTNALSTSAMSALTAEEQAALAASRSSAAGSAEAGALGARGAATGVGGRAGAGGAGAGGRGGRGRKKKRPDGIDFYEDNDDWVDDEEASPGILH